MSGLARSEGPERARGRARFASGLLRSYDGRATTGTGTTSREQLRAAQRPLKEHYRQAPEAALVTLRAEGSLDDQEVACSVETSRALVRAGLHPATGGSGTLACSGDMLLQALVACAGVTLRSVATSLEISVTGRVRAEGDLDFRGTLGVANDGEAPVGFRAIRLIFELGGEATEEQLETLLRLTERYCVVYQTLAGGVPVSVSTVGIRGSDLNLTR